MKNNKNKRRSKTRFYDPIKKCAKLTTKLLTAALKPKVVDFKMDEYPINIRVYLLFFMNSLKVVLYQFKETYMLIMEYPSKIWEDLSDYSKKATWNLLNAYIDAHITRIID